MAAAGTICRRANIIAVRSYKKGDYAMNDLSKLEKELKSIQNVDKIKNVAASPEGQRLSKTLDTAAIEKAVKSGNTAAMQSMIGEILKSSDGQELYRQIQNALKGK